VLLKVRLRAYSHALFLDNDRAFTYVARSYYAASARWPYLSIYVLRRRWFHSSKGYSSRDRALHSATQLQSSMHTWPYRRIASLIPASLASSSSCIFLI
jgi:hypothetical protein